MNELDLALIDWTKIREARIRDGPPLTVVERYLEGCRRNMMELGIWEKAYPPQENNHGTQERHETEADT